MLHQKILAKIRQFGGFLLKNRQNAIVAAMLSAAIPLLGWASLVIVSLVTLRKGPKEGILVVFWAILPASLSVYWLGSWTLVAEGILAYVFLWSLAWVLRVTASWRYVLELAAGAGLLIIILFHAAVPDLNQLYFNYLLDFYKQTGADAGAYANIQPYLQQIVYYLLGMQVALYLFNNLFCLCIGRWVQSLLYNPQGLSKELKNIRLSFFPWIIGVVFALAGVKMSQDWALDTLPVFILLFTLAGISFVHYLIENFSVSGNSSRLKVPVEAGAEERRSVTPKKSKLKQRSLLFGFYILFGFLIPFSLIPVILLAFVDTGWNIRRKFSKKHVEVM